MEYKVSSSKPVDKDAIMTPIEAARDQWLIAPPECYATEQAKVIFLDVLPDVLSRFVSKNADYGDDTANFLGARGQFADINPKFWKLKRALWDGKPLLGESVHEILSDLIGHCLLALYFLENESELPSPKPKQIVIVPDDEGDLPAGSYQFDGVSGKWVRMG